MEQPQKILIVDDDKDVLDLLEYNLSTEGYRILCVDDPAIALQSALQFRPNLIVLDLMMPNINGLILCSQLRGLHQFYETPIFFLTSAGDRKNADEAYRCGADDFIHKTAGVRSLVNRITLVMESELTIRKRVTQLDIGRWHFSRHDCTVRYRAHTTQLSSDEFEVAFFIAQNAEHVISMHQLDKMFGGSTPFSSNIDKCMERLLEKLGDKWVHWKGKTRLQFRDRYFS